ncbi:hypothetical protein BO83DRAFT_439844 [Aspergillus eucalypticola CBS 122712]|uniref:Uncharacterized protein n=1 Tax=Aspergillus eucalypticola (strain CBS 122712 / IBT 29274) TaxID=1448314 RepID=A0A317UX50_ASPEC|nr:uncharacterized protein BO83DRAFT_439844 [Aspergillus eucalypticola CBS 122712]PWY66593.1 hypothetical protein BO83DRAFT_439844 [Aspergillus eucalypticola CBS 122712]
MKWLHCIYCLQARAGVCSKPAADPLHMFDLRGVFCAALNPKMDPNALYIALFIRDDPPKPNDYHWALYHHRINSGIKYHITNEGNG